MAYFHNYVENSDWGEEEVYAVIYYDVSYDSKTNTSTVTFQVGDQSCTHRIWSDANTDASAVTTVTVTATDSNNTGTTRAESSVHLPHMGYEVAWASFSPKTITVKHNNTAGEKKVKISASSTFEYYYGWNRSASNTTSTTVSSGTHTPIAYKLSISAGTGSTITVNRTFASNGTTGNLSNGATIHGEDKLKITFGANTGYAIKTHTVNGSTFTSGNTHTVSGNVTVVATAEAQGLIYIYNGTSWDMYQVFIDNGTSWDQYIPYVDNGTSWDMCS